MRSHRRYVWGWRTKYVVLFSELKPRARKEVVLQPPDHPLLQVGRSMGSRRRRGKLMSTTHHWLWISGTTGDNHWQSDIHKLNTLTFSIGDIWSIRGSGHVLTVGQGDTGQLGLGEDVMEKTRPQVRVLLDVQHYKLRLRKLKNYFTWNSRWLLALSLQWMLLLEACTLLCWTPTERLLFWNGTFPCKWTGFSGLDFWLQRRRIPGQDNWGGGRELSAWRGLDHICDYEASILSNR